VTGIFICVFMDVTRSRNNGISKTLNAQFFITFGPAAHLDGKHVVFGKIVEGLDVLKVGINSYCIFEVLSHIRNSHIVDRSLSQSQLITRIARRRPSSSKLADKLVSVHCS
jgi:cyclophilin family peptidyl-prolyl cis-trans isomerase